MPSAPSESQPLDPFGQPVGDAASLPGAGIHVLLGHQPAQVEDEPAPRIRRTMSAIAAGTWLRAWMRVEPCRRMIRMAAKAPGQRVVDRGRKRRSLVIAPGVPGDAARARDRRSARSLRSSDIGSVEREEVDRVPAAGEAVEIRHDLAVDERVVAATGSRRTGSAASPASSPRLGPTSRCGKLRPWQFVHVPPVSARRASRWCGGRL